MDITFFENQKLFRDWLEKNHLKKTEIIVGFYKVKSKKPSLTWSESVDQALCFGWIDGIRRTINHESYSIRFTPRKAKSIWSAINIKKIENLTKAGLMKPEGLKAFELKNDKYSKIYSHENSPLDLSKEYIKEFEKYPIAFQYFKNQAPSYQKVIIHWIMSAKKDETKLSRLQKVIESSINLKRIQ
jgi:uncharacterized protein YdeI (YjbR/CyaY-like superfamily)